MAKRKNEDPVLEEATGRQFRPNPDGNGVQFRPDKMADWQDVPDDFALPHVFTFAGIISGAAKTYYHDKWDVALIDSRENALAMKNDCFLMGLMEEKFEAIESLKWHLEPDNPKDQFQVEVADGVTKAIRHTPYFRRLLRSIEWAEWYGRAACQIRWQWKVLELPVTQQVISSAVPGSKAGQDYKKMKCLVPRKHRPINGDKLGWTFDGVPYVLNYAGQPVTWGEQIITTYGPAVKLSSASWRERFIIHTHNPEDADWLEPEKASRVYGVGARDRIYFTNYMRNEYMAWVADTLERIGLGIVVIYYDMGNAKSEQAATEAAKKYSRRSILCLPRTPDGRLTGGGIEIIDAPTAGAEMLMKLWKDLENKIERYIIGQNMSGGKDADNGDGFGGTGQSDFAKDTKFKKIASSADELGETLTGSDDEPSLVNTMKRWIYGPDADFSLRFKFNTEEADPARKMEMIEKAAGLGVTFSMDKTRELTGEPAPEPDEETIGGAQQMGEGGMPGEPEDQFAELDEEDPELDFDQDKMPVDEDAPPPKKKEPAKPEHYQKRTTFLFEDPEDKDRITGKIEVEELVAEQ